MNGGNTEAALQFEAKRRKSASGRKCQRSICSVELQQNFCFEPDVFDAALGAKSRFT